MGLILNYILIYCITVIIANTASQTEDEDYRLPNIYEPISYYIKISLNHDAFTESNNEFTGEVQSIFMVKNETDSVNLHAHHEYININRIRFKDKDVTSDDYSVNNVTDILRINTSTLTTGSIGILLIEYTAILSTTDNNGFFKSSYTDDDGNINYLTMTFLSPIYARRVFPCFDEPALKATFDFTFVFSSHLNILFNTLPFYVATNETTGLKTISFKSTPKMSTYILAFMISDDFTCTEGISASDVSIEVCSRRSTAASRKLALQYGALLLDSLNNYTGFDYGGAIEKVSHVACRSPGGYAMENWGLITYTEKALLWDESESSNRYKQEVVTIMAHELAHQWFGNLVTENWWSMTFLSEGFATYFQYYIPHEVLPTWEFDKQFVIEGLHFAFLHDAQEYTHALYNDAYTSSEILAAFSMISYYKGAGILRMIEGFIGKDRFQEGVRNYVAMNKFKTVKTEDLWISFNISGVDSILHLPADFNTVMDNWITQPGYPVLYVSVQEGKVTISQKRFVTYVSQENFTTKWYVPISYTTSLDLEKFEQTAPILWLTPDKNETFTLPINCSWIILNNKQSAYYRVNYDDELWNNITTALLSDNFDGISDINRAQIVDDLFNLALSTALRYPRAFNALKFLANDISYYSWYPAFPMFEYLLQKVGENSFLGKSISRTVLGWLSALYNSVPISKLNADDQIYTLKQVLAHVWACKLGSQDCIQQSQTLFHQYKSTGIRPNKNLRPFVYCYALSDSNDSSDWNFLWDAYLDIRPSDFETQQSTIVSALGCSRNETILKEYLNKAITDGSGIRSQDVQSVFSAVYKSSPEGLNVAFEFLMENFEIMAARDKSNLFGHVLREIAERLTTETQISKLRTFMKNENLPEAFQKAANESLETANKNLEWLKAYGNELTDYFNRGYRSVDISFWTLVAAVLLLSNHF